MCCYGFFCPTLRCCHSVPNHGGERGRLLEDELSTDAANQVLRMLGIDVFCANFIELTATLLQQHSQYLDTIIACLLRELCHNISLVADILDIDSDYISPKKGTLL